MFNTDQFLQNLSEQLSNANKIVSWFEESRYFLYAVPDEEDLYLQKLEIEIFQLYHKIIFALEYLGLNTSLGLFFKEYEKLDGQPMFKDVPYIDITVCPKIDLMWHYMNIVGCQTAYKDKPDETKSYNIAILERILRGTGKIISDSKIIPNNETDVKKAIYQTLIHVFPDTVSEIPIPKVVKTFKPDIGVKGIKCAIEYKFADSLNEVKKCIGGIYEDMMGYEGTDDWIIFFAVLYMTDNYFTQDQIEAEFKHSKVKKNWKPIVVYGKGERRQVDQINKLQKKQ